MLGGDEMQMVCIWFECAGMHLMSCAFLIACRGLNSYGSGYSQGYAPSPNKNRSVAQMPGAPGRGIAPQGRGRIGPDMSGRGRGRRGGPGAGGC